MPDGEPVYVGWGQIHDEARAVAAALQAKGLVPGDHVAVLGPTSRELITIVRGCWMAGLASMVLPLPMRMGSLEVFVKSTRARIRHGDAKLVLIDDQLAAFYSAVEGDPPIEPMRAVMPGSPNVPSGDRLELPPHDPERLVILQYTSGSTSEPKGVMIPDRVLSANLDAWCEAAELGDEEVMVSWLPLYHDMGLVGFLALPMTKGVELVQAAPQDFIAHPGQLDEVDLRISRHRDRRTELLVGARDSGAQAQPKASTSRRSRSHCSGAEPVDPKAVEAFVAEAEPFGFSAGGVFPAFGMAETAIAGIVPAARRRLMSDTVDREVLERSGSPSRSRSPIPTTSQCVPAAPVARHGGARARDEGGRPRHHEELPERHVGELLLRGTSVTPGYYKREAATAALFHDGWLCTGDLAYLLDGELVMCGRIKDVIIVGGRNVFPEDIERAVGGLDGVRAGNVIAFGIEGYKGKESVVVVAEKLPTRGWPRRRCAATSTIGHSRCAGFPPATSCSSSRARSRRRVRGKLQRAKCREQYLNEELQLVG